MPRFGVTMNTGKVVSWKKSEGDEVKSGEVIVIVESEKATVEVESPYSGLLKKILVEEGEEVPVGIPLAVIAAADEEIDLDELNNYYKAIKTSAGKDEGETKEDGAIAAGENQENRDRRDDTMESKVKISPKARRLAKKMGVAPETIQGSGPGGAITEKDIHAAVDSAANKKTESEAKKLSTLQKAMSSNVTASWQSIPQFTQIVTVDATSLLETRKQLENISINDLIVKCIARAVLGCPFVNSSFDHEQIVYYKRINLSVAMATEKGLVVPVINDADGKNVQEISRELQALYEKATAGKLSKEDLDGGTLTISNLGYYGIETGTPIINYPQSTLVFIGAIRKSPVVENDQVVVKPCLKTSIAYDHRFIDGATAAKFTNRVKKELEEVSQAKLSS